MGGHDSPGSGEVKTAAAMAAVNTGAPEGRAEEEMVAAVRVAVERAAMRAAAVKAAAVAKWAAAVKVVWAVEREATVAERGAPAMLARAEERTART